MTKNIRICYNKFNNKSIIEDPMRNLEFINWLSIKALSNSQFAKLTIVVPIIGWILVYNDHFRQLLENIYSIKISVELSWKLHCFYLGLVFISISAVFFIFFCPYEIKNYISESDFITIESEILTKVSDDRLSKSINIEPITWRYPSDTYKYPDGSFPFARLKEANQDKINDQLKKVFFIKNHSLKIIRFMTFTFFLFGSLLALIPTFSTVIWSFNYIIENAF